MVAESVHIRADLAGASGVDSIEAMDDDLAPNKHPLVYADVTERDKPEYRAAVARICADINAAAAGAFDAGAKRVRVSDNHGDGGILDPSLLDPRLEIVPGASATDWLEQGCGAVLCVGYHAMGGTRNAFLDHTQSAMCRRRYWVNSRLMGEVAQTAMIAAADGVPVVMVSGDEAVCLEARRFLGPVATAAVKHARGRNAAVCLPSERSLELIREAARRGVTLVGEIHPFTPLLPLEIVLEFQRQDYCDRAVAEHRLLERLDARRVRWIADDYRGCVL